MMNETDVRRLAKTGGICCISGTLCYLAAAFAPLPDNLSYAVAMCWPVLSIVFAYAIRGVIGAERESLSNSLAFVFACIAFATVASMISVQLAVRMGAAEYVAAPGADVDLYAAIRKTTRMVDLGMDVAWDFFIGATLFFLGVALAGDSRFGRAWGALTSGFGLALVVLNSITFPWPPDTRGLFDLGPFIGIFLIAMGVRLTMIGFRRPNPAG
jgi:hypothetical protein